MRSLPLVMVAGFSVLLVSCQPDSDGPDLRQGSLPIIGGTPDHSVAHKGVVMIGGPGFWCSGTLVAPLAVLTAAHCANSGSPSDYMVYFGDELNSAEGRGVNDVFFHPLYDPPTTGSYVYDIAMMQLDEPAPDWAKPIPYLPSRLGLTTLDLGETIEYVGFGRDEEDNIGVKLKVSSTIDFMCKVIEGCDYEVDGYHAASFFNTVCSSHHLGSEGTCSGDSGGPGFIVRSGQEYVAAVTSYGDRDCHYYGCSTIVSAYETFISDFIGTYLEQGEPCTNSTECLSGYCKDGVCCESACVATCMACNHPGREGECDVAPDGYPCPDDDPCDGQEICSAGACSEGPPLECISDDQCLTGICRSDMGCVYVPAEDGLPCDNLDPCDGQDRCQGGECFSAGIPQDCSDGDPCTLDTCDNAEGCQHSPMPDGAACPDDDLCNGDEYCTAGVCAAEEPLDCDDINACTEDSCDARKGCLHQRLPDGTVCGDCRSCEAGLCLPDDDCGDEGCGCNSGNPVPGSTLAGLLLVMLALSRRRTGSD